MNPDEARKLLGGYATGSLTDQERISLFEAALDDQELFDQLAEEDALRELIDGPGVRDRLLTTLAPEQPSPSFWSLLWRPWPIAGLAGTAATLVILWVALHEPAPQVNPPAVASTTTQAPVEVAENRNVPPSNRERGREATVPIAPTVAQPKVKAAPAPAGIPIAPQGDVITGPVTTAQAPAIAPQAVAALQPDRERDSAAARSDATPPKAEKTSAASNDAASTIVVNGTPANSGIVVAQAPAPSPPAPAAPPAKPVPTPSGAVGGFVSAPFGGGAAKGGAAAAGARTAQLAQTVQFGFRYQVSQGSLQITPNSAGWLTVRGVGDGPSVVIFAAGEVPAGSALKFDIPANAQRLTIEFAVTGTSAVGAVEQRAELQGAAATPNPTENSHLAISIPARP